MNHTNNHQLLSDEELEEMKKKAESHTHVNVPKVEDELTNLEIEELEETSGGMIAEEEPGMTTEEAEDAVGLAASTEVEDNLNTSDEEAEKQESIS